LANLGSVLGPIDRPDVLIAGRSVSSSPTASWSRSAAPVPPTASQSAEAGAVPPPAAGDLWQDEIGTGRWSGKNTTVPLTKVAPTVIVGVSATAALQAGAW